ncbi:hypothetical protein [Caulobacter sp. S45]|uniref:hypothetical protein n=1 Tax=Caulobacter sp. S45 TaxID=1641861 RepID=UPI0020B15677|nr:hypothetical protein [Caulobacter sp. S45]
MSQASTISGMVLSPAQSLGVASFAALVHALSTGRGISLDALHITFLVMGAGSLLAVPFFVLSPADAGAEMSGRAGLHAGVPG